MSEKLYRRIITADRIWYEEVVDPAAAPLTADALFDILYEHIELDYLHASDGHPEIVGFSGAVEAIISALSRPLHSPTENKGE
jgi:hypothetical protein